MPPLGSARPRKQSCPIPARASSGQSPFSWNRIASDVTRRLRVLLPCFAVWFAWAASGGDVAACEMCRHFGSTAYHVEAIGGDDPNDALFIAPEPEEPEEGGSGQYSLVGGKWPQPDGLGTPVTITYSYNNFLDGGLKDSDGVSLPVSLLRGSVEEALGLWASVAPLHFVEVEDEGGPAVLGQQYPDGQFGQIRFNHISYNGPDPPDGSPTAKALAYYPSSSGNLAGDVFFDEDDPWQEFGTLHEPDPLGASAHELGHTLGLGHSANSNANMYWIFTRYEGLGTGALHADDIAGIQAIYGAGVGSVTPLAPEPASWVLALLAATTILFGRGLRSRRSGSGQK